MIIKPQRFLSLHEAKLKPCRTQYTTYKTVEELNKKLNNFDYGIVVGNKKYTGSDIDYTKYRTIPPEVFEKFKCGTCWDYTCYEAEYFEKNFTDIDYTLYYMQLNTTDDIEPTHTFLTYTYFSERDIWYLFESAWKRNKGLHGGDSWRENIRLKEYIETFKEEVIEEQKCEVTGYIMTKFEPPTKYGLTPPEFMKHCLGGEVVINKNFKYKELN